MNDQTEDSPHSHWVSIGEQLWPDWECPECDNGSWDRVKFGRRGKRVELIVCRGCGTATLYSDMRLYSAPAYIPCWR